MILVELLRIISVAFLVLILIEASPGSSLQRKDIKQVKLRNKKEGEWSSWLPWTPCSRPCGGGIRSQTRQCQIRRSRMKSKEAIDETKMWKNVTTDHCEGHGTRHHLCNGEDCSTGTVGIRESQCMTFDKKHFMGKKYQWEAFVDERSPCSLTCRAKGFRFFTTLKQTVIDGTPCPGQRAGGDRNQGTDLYRCVMGQCMSIGCDGIAGSQRRLDRCGVCGGDNSTCRVISGIFTRPQLPVGYNIVAHIPRGACNLNISQIRKSPNYLALRRNDGSYILNGNWAISWPGDYEGAGSKFRYTRQDSKAVESIDAIGPLTEPVDLLLLSQQPNPGIKYEYLLPLSDQPPPLPAPESLTYRPAGFVQLTRDNPNPGGGPQGWSESAYSTKPQIQVQMEHPRHHGHQGRSAHRRTHEIPNGLQDNAKRFFWKITGYSDCSEPCGGGTQKSIVKCIKEATGMPVHDRRCGSAEKIGPQNPVRCNLKPCPAEWTVGPWSGCSERCGEGTHTRTVNCQQRISPTLTIRVAEGACLAAQPLTQKACYVKSCHRWETAPWSACSTSCGSGVRTRAIKCVGVEGQLSKECLTQEKPIEISPCNMGSCEGVDWFLSDWSHDCESCSAGIQSRDVVCAELNPDRRRVASSSETETNQINDDNESENAKGKCDSSSMPSKERQCGADKECRDADWFAGPWTACSSSCGNGIQTRHVVCVIFTRVKFRVVEDSRCGSSKPASRQECVHGTPCQSRWFMTDWSECSVSCGGGSQRRSVSCRGSNVTQTSFTCSDPSRPLDRRRCGDLSCDRTTSRESVVKSSQERDSRESTTRRMSSFPSNAITTTNTFLELNAEPDSGECTDQYKNCALVVQARLCRYKYYRSVCCTSCAEN